MDGPSRRDRQTARAMNKSLAGLGRAVLLGAGMFATCANADTNFFGHWTQVDTEHRCSVVLGFLLRADGSASVDWAAFQNGAADKSSRFVVEHRRGRWRSTGDTLHLSVIDVLSNPTILKDVGKTAPIRTEINVDGTVAAGGNRLESIITDSRDRNIDGQPYTIRCAYLRDKP